MKVSFCQIHLFGNYASFFPCLLLWLSLKVETFAQKVKRAGHLFVQSFGLILGDFGVDL